MPRRKRKETNGDNSTTWLRCPYCSPIPQDGHAPIYCCITVYTSTFDCNKEYFPDCKEGYDEYMRRNACPICKEQGIFSEEDRLSHIEECHIDKIEYLLKKNNRWMNGYDKCACRGCSDSLRHYRNPSIHYFEEHGLELHGIDTLNKRALINMFGRAMAEHLWNGNNPDYRPTYFVGEF